jgi:tol-pal system protein YbgF
LADNAQYWLGEAYYVNKSYPEAELAFQHVVDKYPQSRKLPDALLKIGFCRYELKEWDSARLVLSRVVTQYGDSQDAQLAKQRLDKMTAENH